MHITAVLTPKETIAQTEEVKQTSGTSENFSDCLDEAITDNSLLSIFQKASKTYGVSLSLLTAMAKQESDFQANATSKSGAMGIMQLMPSTAEHFGCSNPYDPEENIMTGARYISELLERYDGNVSYALAAYNAGYNNVDKYGGIPPFEETQNYVAKITAYMSEGVTLPDGTNIEGSGSASLSTGMSGLSDLTNALRRLNTNSLDKLFSLLTEVLKDSDTSQQSDAAKPEPPEEPAPKTLDVAVVSTPDMDAYYASQAIHYNNSVLNLMSQNETTGSDS